jgi:hypothetical protein
MSKVFVELSMSLDGFVAGHAPSISCRQVKGEMIMTNSDTLQAAQQPPTPAPDLKGLDKLVGAWNVSGGAQGQVRYEWMDGGFFLMQHIDLENDGRQIKGIEIIGHLQPFGEEPSEEIKSRYYGSTGETFDYVYELDGDTLTIWGGEKGSPAFYRGTFSADGKTLTGGWTYPGGGGYASISTRID